MNRLSRLPVLCIIFLAAALMLGGCAGPSHLSKAPATVERPQNDLQERWGIRVVSVRVTAAGHMLDFSYRITDAEKAAALLQKQAKPHLIDQATGTKMGVPRTKLGPMRQTALLPKADRNYRMLFDNAGGVVKAGSKVTIVIGDLKLEDLVVE